MVTSLGDISLILGGSDFIRGISIVVTSLRKFSLIRDYTISLDKRL